MKIPPATGDYEVDRQRHVKPFFERLPNEIDKLTWSLEKLHQLRDRRLVKLIRHAKEYSPWHTKRLNRIDPDTFKSDQLVEIPTITKNDLEDKTATKSDWLHNWIGLST